MGEVLERMDGGRRSVAVAAAIPESLLLAPPEFEGAHDPHVWFDVRLWLYALGAVEEALVASWTPPTPPATASAPRPIAASSKPWTPSCAARSRAFPPSGAC